MAGKQLGKDEPSGSCKVSTQKRAAYFSTVRKEKCSFKWTIECFSRLSAAKNSPLFPSENDEEKYKWILTIYPNGEDHSSEGYLCIKLSHKKGKFLLADLELRLRDSREHELYHRRDEAEGFHGSTYTWQQVINKQHLKTVLEDDILVIDLNIICIVEEVNRYHEPGPPIPYLRMVDNYADLKKSGKLCDAMVIVGTTKIPVHSLVLAARSPVFMAMFEHSTEENETRVIQIEDIDCKTMQCFLDFMYSCELPEFDLPLAMNVLKAADKYDVSDLKELCENHLAMSLNTSNVIEILLLADMYNAKCLKAKAMEYICMNKSRLSEIENFDTPLEKNVRALADILHSMANTP